MIIATTDFIGVYKISTDNYSQLDNYITQFEPKYLRAILGDDNYTAIEANPTHAKYSDLLTDSLKEALIGFIYFHYVSDNFLNTTVGNTFNSNENSVGVGNSVNAQITINRHNAACELINTNVYDWLVDYMKYDETVTSQTTNIAGTLYDLFISDTTYLNIGDSVTINDTEYTISDLTVDTKIQITDVAGVNFVGKEVIWYPYYNELANKVEEIVI